MRNVRIVLGLALICVVAISTVTLADSNADKLPPFAGIVYAPVNNAAHLVYNPLDDSFRALAIGNKANGDPLVLTSFDLRSRGDKLNPANMDPSWWPGPSPDVITGAKFFKLDTNGFNDTLLGIGITTGTPEEMLADLTISGSLGGGGYLSDAPGGGPWLWVVPEPSSAVLLCIGMLIVVRRRQ